MRARTTIPPFTSRTGMTSISAFRDGDVDGPPRYHAGREIRMSVIVGWDIGGAHLKAARAEHGRIVDAVQVPSPLRLGLDALAQSFAAAKAHIGAADLHAVTMTGELADTFVSRREGVESLIAIARREFSRSTVTVYAGRAGFIPPEAARAHVEDIASANWHATASLVGRVLDAALFIDI